MGAHYCKVCGEYCAGGSYTIDKDGNDLCNLHGQELLERLEERVRELEEMIKYHEKVTRSYLQCQRDEPTKVDLELWKLAN